MSTEPTAGLGKIYDTPRQSLSGLEDGATILVGGFAGHCEPESLIQAVIDGRATGLTVISGGGGPPRSALNGLIATGAVRKLVSPLPFDPRQGGPVKELWQSGQLELEVLPTGVLSERLRAGGAGIGGVFLPTGAGTRFAEGREVRNINGREHVFQPAIKADFALLRASTADTLGNLIYNGTQRNWNPVMAMAARTTVAEVERVVDPGGIDPEVVITPAIYVQRLVLTQS